MTRHPDGGPPRGWKLSRGGEPLPIPESKRAKTKRRGRASRHVVRGGCCGHLLYIDHKYDPKLNAYKCRRCDCGWSAEGNDTDDTLSA